MAATPSPPQGTGSIPYRGINATYQAPPKNYFYFSEYINRFRDNFEQGIFFVLPLVAAYFSVKYALAIVVIEVLSYFVGILVIDFENWINSNDHYQDKNAESDKIPPKTELEMVLERLRYFENKYIIDMRDIYYYLESGRVPIQDNLDWIEMVSLINQLSLYMGKHFDNREKKGETQ